VWTGNIILNFPAFPQILVVIAGIVPQPHELVTYPPFDDANLNS